MSIYVPNAIQTIQGDFAPQIEPSGDSVPAPLRQDPDGNLLSRGTVLTDEGTIRANFANASIAVSVGTITLTNGSKVLTGTNFAQYDVHVGDHVKLDADAESAWAQIDYFETADRAILVANYTGTGGTSAGSRAYFRPYTGSGGTISVASGQLTIASGGTASSISGIERVIDYSPLIFRDRLSISQRVTNQEIRFGLKDPSSPVKYFSRFVATGTTNTVINCVTGRNPTGVPSASETQTTTITLPRGVTTAVLNEYRIEQLVEVCRFFVNGVLVASHFNVLPQQYDELEGHIEVENTGAASNTNIVVDYIAVKNHNKVEVGILSEADSIVVNQPTLEVANFTQAGVIGLNTDIQIIDCRQLRSVNCQITSIGTTGRIDFFLTNDLSVTGTAQPAYPIGGGAGVTTTLAAGHFNIPTNGAAYLRVRMGVATTAGTTTVFTTGSQMPVTLPLPTTQPVSGTVTSNIGTGTLSAVTTVTTVSAVTSSNSGIPSNIIDVASAAITSTATTSAFTPTFGSSYQIIIPSTVVTGTNPTADFSIEESEDGGTNWLKIWDFERVTTTGILRSPMFPLTGNRVRFVQTIGGATPSFTRSIQRVQSSNSATVKRRLIDRSITLTTLNSTSPILNTGGASIIQLVVAVGAITTTAPQLIIEGSEEATFTNFYTLPVSALTAVASSTVQTTLVGVSAPFIRVKVSVAGVGVTANYIALKAFN